MSEEAGFWDTGKIIIVLAFAIGLVIGGVAANQVIDPYLNGAVAGDYNALAELNSRLDSRNDSLYNCLLENNINPVDCG